MIKLIFNRFADQELEVDIKVKTDTSSTKPAKEDVARFRKEIEATADPIASLTKAFKNLDYSKLVYMWHTVTRVTRGLVNMVSSAAEYEESLNLYTMALGEYAEQASKWSQTLTDKLMLDPSPFMQYMGAFYNFAKGLNVTKDAAFLMSQNLTQLTYDMASYLNISNEAAQAKLQSAMAGQSRAVASVGVAMQVASLQELAYSLGIKKTVKDMTQAEKTYLRYIQLMRSTTQMQGDLGRTMITPANAIRALKNQISMLGRAIGQVLTPLIMQAIPYIIAFANVLKRAAEALARFFGYQIADVDYSSAISFEDAGEGVKNLNAIGGAAKKAGDSVKNSLAPFDELNQVMFDNKTAGSGGIGGIGGGIDTSGWDALLPTYDMLKDYNDQFAKKAKDLEGRVKKIGLILLGIVGASILGKAIIGISKLLTAFKNIKSTLATVSTSFGEFAKKAGFSVDIFKGVASAIGKIAGTIGLGITAFASGYNIMKSWDGTVEDIRVKLIETVGIVGALTGAAALLAGPWGALAVAIAGATGLVVGYNKAWHETQIEMEKQEGFPDIINNQGIAIQNAYGLIKSGLQGVADNATVLSTLVDKNDEAKVSWENAKQSFDQFLDSLASGEITYSTQAEAINGITNAINNTKQAALDKLTADKTNELESLRILAEETDMTESEYNERKKIIEGYYDLQLAGTKGYYEEYKKLLIQRQNGTISEKEFADKVKELHENYLGLNTAVNDATTTAANYLAAQNGKIDFKDPEKLRDIIKDTTKSRQEYIDNENKAHEKETALWKGKVTELQGVQKQIEETYGEYKNMPKNVQEIYDQNAKTIDVYTKNIESESERHEKAVESINSTYKNFLATILLELNATGNDQKETFKGTISDINKEMGKIGKDVDINDSVVDFFGKYTYEMDREGSKMSTDMSRKFNKWGINAGEQYSAGLLTEGAKAADKYSAAIDSELEKYNRTKIAPNQYNRARGTGNQTADGYINGVAEKELKVKREMEEGLCEASIMSPVEKGLQIGSPSRVFEQYGIWIVAGLDNGIKESKNNVLNTMSNLTTDLKKSLDSASFSIDVKTNVESSFNQILSKLQKFCDKWRSAINSLASGMKTTMNGIKIDKSGKVTYTSMPKVNVSTFEQGGFPTKGDLFFANENGVPEYITTIGNKTAVANNDQMAKAVSNAIISAMDNYSNQINNEPSTIIVQLGNETIYKGHGEYQSRESDRYGTSYVKI